VPQVGFHYTDFDKYLFNRLTPNGNHVYHLM